MEILSALAVEMYTQAGAGSRMISYKCTGRLPTMAHANGVNRDKSLSLCPE